VAAGVHFAAYWLCIRWPISDWPSSLYVLYCLFVSAMPQKF